MHLAYFFYVSLSLSRPLHPLALAEIARVELETFSPFAGETRRIAKPGVGELMEGLKER